MVNKEIAIAARAGAAPPPRRGPWATGPVIAGGCMHAVYLNRSPTAPYRIRYHHQELGRGHSISAAAQTKAKLQEFLSSHGQYLKAQLDTPEARPGLQIRVIMTVTVRVTVTDVGVPRSGSSVTRVRPPSSVKSGSVSRSRLAAPSHRAAAAPTASLSCHWQLTRTVLPRPQAPARPTKSSVPSRVGYFLRRVTHSGQNFRAPPAPGRRGPHQCRHRACLRDRHGGRRRHQSRNLAPLSDSEAPLAT